MIRKLFMFATIALVFASCGSTGTNEEVQEETLSMEAAETETPVIALGEFETKAGNYVDQEVMVEGIVDHICKHGGKRLLLVTDEGDVHVDAETRFDESIEGSSIALTGIVREFRVDEGYCLKMEEDNIKSHSEGQTDEEMFEHKKAQIQEYRDEMAEKGVDHLSFYSLDYVSHDVIKQENKNEI